MHPRLFQFGHFAIPTYGAFTALALVAALAALVYFARRLALDPNKLWNLGLIGILTALIATRLLLVAEYLGAFRFHPVWVLGLTANRSPWISPVALLLGLAAAILYAMAEGLPILPMFDCAAPCVSLALVLSDAGAFVAGVDFGRPAARGWSIAYSSHIAAFWYHTPLGVRLYPVQLYQALASLAILSVLIWWLPRRTQQGELFGVWLFLSGFAGFLLDFYRAANQSSGAFHRSIFAIMVVASVPFLLRRKPGGKTRGYTEVDDPPHI